MELKNNDRDLLLNGMDDLLLQNSDKKKRKIKWLVKNLPLAVIIVIVFVYYTMFSPFSSKDTIIHISSGQSISSITKELKDKNTIRSEFILKSFVKILKSGKGVVSGDYLISKGTPVWKVAWQIGRGHHNLEPTKITIREGLTNEEIASLLADKLAGFRKDLFLSLVNDKQGYLFPDTYFFFPLDTADEIVNKLSNNFDNKIKTISSELNKSNKSLNDIITMASILEGEANGKNDIYIISGILWKRISLGMPLQVDVDKSTYKNKGLPDNPINNPGLLSIKASINGENSPYLYYLHDSEGVVHFAKSFEEHKLNIQKYLK